MNENMENKKKRLKHGKIVAKKIATNWEKTFLQST